MVDSHRWGHTRGESKLSATCLTSLSGHLRIPVRQSFPQAIVKPWEPKSPVNQWSRRNGNIGPQVTTSLTGILLKRGVRFSQAKKFAFDKKLCCNLFGVSSELRHLAISPAVDLLWESWYINKLRLTRHIWQNRLDRTNSGAVNLSLLNCKPRSEDVASVRIVQHLCKLYTEYFLHWLVLPSVFQCCSYSSLTKCSKS